MVTSTKDSDCFLWVFCSRLLDRSLYVVLTGLLGGGRYLFLRYYVVGRALCGGIVVIDGILKKKS